MPKGEIPSSPGFVVLGLGNPGPEYESTRHNFGFLVVDALAASVSETFRAAPGPVRICSFTEGDRSGILAKPTTWMNRSGRAGRALLDRFESLSPENMLVVTDDLDLPLGRIRLRRGGGNGGHNGLRSVIDEFETRDFPRLRLGIGRPDGDEREEVVDHVLEPFLEEERDLVEEIVHRAADSVRLFVASGIEAAMNRFNAGEESDRP